MSNRIPRRVLDHALEQPWAIMPDALMTILDIAARQNLTPEAVAAELGRPLDNTRTVTVRDGVATIPIVGPLFRRASLFSAISGAASYEQIATDLQAAVDDRQVRAILLAIDSPGGEVSGVSDLARLIRAAGEEKRIVAHVDGVAASAAYWLASAADEVVASESAVLGSIGVVASFTDRREQDAKGGLRTHTIISSQSPGKHPDPSTETGRQRIQATVDALADVFLADVAEFRGVSHETAMERFGQGDVLVGRAAVTAGLADRVGTQESTHADLSAPPSRGADRISRRALTQESIMSAAHPDKPTASAAAPEPVATPEPAVAPAAPVAAAVAADPGISAIEAERARVAALLDLPAAGHEKLVREAISSGATAGEVSMAILAAEASARRSHLNALAATEGKLSVPPPDPSADGGKPEVAPQGRAKGRAMAARYYHLITRS